MPKGALRISTSLQLSAELQQRHRTALSRHIPASHDGPEIPLGAAPCADTTSGKAMSFTCVRDPTKQQGCGMKAEGNKRALWIGMNLLFIEEWVHRKGYLWYQKPPGHLFILIVEKIFPRGHLSVLQGLPERQEAAGSLPPSGIACRRWIRSCRIPLSSPWITPTPSPAGGKPSGVSPDRECDSDMEPGAELTPQCLLGFLNEGKRKIAVDYSAGGWSVGVNRYWWPHRSMLRHSPEYCRTFRVTRGV